MERSETIVMRVFSHFTVTRRTCVNWRPVQKSHINRIASTLCFKIYNSYRIEIKPVRIFPLERFFLAWLQDWGNPAFSHNSWKCRTARNPPYGAREWGWSHGSRTKLIVREESFVSQLFIRNFCLVCPHRSRNDRKSKVDLLSLQQ